MELRRGEYRIVIRNRLINRNRGAIEVIPWDNLLLCLGWMAGELILPMNGGEHPGKWFYIKDLEKDQRQFLKPAAADWMARRAGDGTPGISEVRTAAQFYIWGARDQRIHTTEALGRKIRIARENRSISSWNISSSPGCG